MFIFFRQPKLGISDRMKAVMNSPMVQIANFITL